MLHLRFIETRDDRMQISVALSLPYFLSLSLSLSLSPAGSSSYSVPSAEASTYARVSLFASAVLCSLSSLCVRALLSLCVCSLRVCSECECARGFTCCECVRVRGDSLVCAGVHLLRMCAGFTCCSECVRGVHLLRVCTGFTCCECVRGSLVVSVCGVHLLQ